MSSGATPLAPEVFRPTRTFIPTMTSPWSRPHSTASLASHIRMSRHSPIITLREKPKIPANEMFR